jgi:serine/threonine-protein kinase
VAGKYRVERHLAEGRTGAVLEATDTERGKPVAIKVLRASARTPEIEARFAREASIAQALESEHLARVDASGHTEAGEPFLVMELLFGRDLAAELAERGRLPVAEAVDVVLEASAGVAEAHAAGLVHRDLKPANLFVARRPSKIKVLDLGLTQAQDEAGQIDLADTEADFGTPQYKSPEQIRSAKQVDARTDQHALGAVLYELLTGKPPFTAPDVTRLAVAIAVEPPPRARDARPDVPRALEDAIRRSLAKQPDDRFADLLTFAEAIAPFGGERSRRALAAVRASLANKAARRSSLREALSSVASALWRSRV